MTAGVGLPDLAGRPARERRAILADFARWEARRDARALVVAALADAEGDEVLVRCLGERLRELGPPVPAVYLPPSWEWR